MSKQACKLSLKKADLKNFPLTSKIENLTNNGEILRKKNGKLILKAKKGKEIKQQ